ncbi:MAG: manganese efflux pump [Ruminococcaceae bacterium]|nr:manganese efflux pump [Oscillospiraceae bacterium]
MEIWELFLIAVGLSMDAFAVSVCKGLSLKKIKAKHTLIAGLYFGGFQAMMPLIGYFAGRYFERFITNIDHWVVFVLLGLIGGNMIKEALGKEEELNCDFNVRAMLPLAIATSIDALAVGITFAILPDVNIFAAVSFIGVITLVLSAVGIYIGNIFGLRYKSKAELLGGIVLIGIGLKILLEHLGVI